ncbi:hypothetical protein [Acinetobacter sp. YH12251]|uniref:hypothetical protein n=1 Tax=Acinetobacter sp. YH12251 TaxID=2601176 RepID=UPI0015D14154|nr:hypothetical protein [Acinetobacter sp. YH12251]
MKVKNILESYYFIFIFIFILGCFSQIYFTLVFYHEFFKNLFLILMVFLSIVCLFMIFTINKFVVNKGFLFIFSFIGFVVISLFFQFLFLPNKVDRDGVYALNHALTTGVSGVAWIIMGAALSFCCQSVRRNNYIGFLLIAIMFLVLFPLISSGGINYWELSKENEGMKLTHLTIAIYSSIILLLANAFIFRYEVVALVFSVIILFILGGRSDLIIFFLTFIVYWVISGKLKISHFFVLLPVFVFLPILAFYFGLLDGIEWGGFENLVKITEDESFVARLILMKHSFANLPEQILFGNPNLLLLDNVEIPALYNTIGANFHNILGFWQYYGFIVWLLCVVYIFYTITILPKYLNTPNLDFVNKFGILLFVFTTLSVVLTKSMTFYLFWMSLGFWSVKFFEKIDKLVE